MVHPELLNSRVTLSFPCDLNHSLTDMQIEKTDRPKEKLVGVGGSNTCETSYIKYQLI